MGRSANQETNQAVYFVDEETTKEYAIMRTSSCVSVAMDADSVQFEHSVYIGTQGYACTRLNDTCVSVHSVIMGEPPSRSVSIDHINRIKHDNRKCNLRWASQSLQNSNRADRCDRMPAPPDLSGPPVSITRLPKYMLWNQGRARFEFFVNDRSFGDALGNVSIYGPSTSDMSVIDKFRFTLQDVMQHEYFGSSKEESNQRAMLIGEYNELVRAAHASDPDIFSDGPYVSMEDVDEDAYLIWCLGRLPEREPDAPDPGPKNKRQCVERVVWEDGTQVCVIKREGESKHLILDAALHDEAILWTKLDTTGGQIRLTRKPIKSIVWHLIHGSNPPEGHSVQVRNRDMFDLRAENLVLVAHSSQAGGETPMMGVPSRQIHTSIDVEASDIPDSTVLVRNGVRIMVDKDFPCGAIQPKFMMSASGIRVELGRQKTTEMVRLPLRDYVWNGYKASDSDDTGGVVVTLNYSHRDVRRSNLARVYGISNPKSVSYPETVQIPEVFLSHAPVDWNGRLPFGLKYCCSNANGKPRHVFTVSTMIIDGKKSKDRWTIERVGPSKFGEMQRVLGEYYRTGVELFGLGRFERDADPMEVFDIVNQRIIPDRCHLARV